MKLRVSVIALASTFASASAFAQNAPVYRYCLQQSISLLEDATLCRYDSLVQCAASKTGPSDLCYLNPAYPATRR